MQATNQENYYDLLGINQNASNDEIKRAYFKKVREFPNETHPEQFQLLSKAYKILKSTDTKKEYDSRLNNEAYAKVFDHALDNIDKEQYSDALSTLKKLDMEYPGNFDIRYHIAICHAHLEQWRETQKAILPLEIKYPENEEVLNLSGQTAFNLNQYAQAQGWYEKLINLYPDNSNYYLNLSSIYIHQEDFNQAAKVLEKKLKREKERIHDFPLLEELFFITMLADDKHYHEEIKKRIKNLYTNQEEKEQLLSMLVKSCEDINYENNGYKELVHLIKEINRGRNEWVNKWLRKAESHIRKDLIYYGDSVPSRQEYHHNSVEKQVSATASAEAYDDGQGSLLFSIIFGIIASFFLTPIGGVIVGFIWYFYAGSLKAIIAGLGCLAIIIITVGLMIISNV